jgi:hypothetical protein
VIDRVTFQLLSTLRTHAHIPDWAIGVAAICGGLGVMVVLMQLGLGLKESMFDAEKLVPLR